MPALPLDDAGPYVAAAYLVFLGLVLVYVAIMAGRLTRIRRDVDELTELLNRRDAARAPKPPIAPEPPTAPTARTLEEVEGK